MSLSMTLTRTLIGVVVHAAGGADHAPDQLAAVLDPNRREAIPHRGLRSRTATSRWEVAGRPVLWMAPVSGATRTVLVYWHGGGFIDPLNPAHWLMLDRLQRRSGATLVVPSYALAPDYRFDDTLPLIDALNERLAAPVGDLRARLVVGGDSAGGALAMAQAIRARDLGGPTIDAVALVAPWVDLSMANPDAWELDPVDVMLQCNRLVAAGRAWAGDRATTDPLVSPLYDRLSGLPPITVYQGGADILAPDARLFAEKAREAGTPTRLFDVPGAPHVYPMAVWTPEARAALNDMAQVILGRA